MNNKIIKLVALTLAVLMLSSLFAACGKKEKEENKKVIIVQKPAQEQEPETENGNGYINDDIELTIGYDGDEEFSILDLRAAEESSEAYVLNILNGSEPMSKTFRGITGAVYHATEYLYENGDTNGRKYTEEMVKLEVKRWADAGLKYVRTTFMSDWMYTGDDSNPWDFDNATMNRFYDWCKLLDSYGITVIINLGWNFGKIAYGSDQYLTEVDYLRPLKLDEHGNPVTVYKWGTYYHEVDWDEASRRYSAWGIAAVKAFAEHGVTNANHLLLFTEPVEHGGMPTGAWFEWQEKVFSEFHESLKAAGLRDKVTLYGPNQSSTSGSAGLVRYFLENAPEVFDVYTSHDNHLIGQTSVDDIYDDAYTVYSGYMHPIDDFDIRYEKEFWLDELGVNGDHFAYGVDDPWIGVWFGANVSAAINAGISGINIWQFVEQLWYENYGSGGEFQNGVQTSGVVPSLYESEMPFSAYYAVTLFSKYMSCEGGKSYYCAPVDESSGLHIAAVEMADGNWSIAVINNTTDSRTFNVNFEKSLGGKTLYRYLYNASEIVPTTAAEIITADKGFTNVNGVLSDTLKGGSVAIYSTIKNTGK